MSFFRSREPRPATEKIENVIGPSAELSGHLKAEGGIRIDGNCDGTIESKSNVIIGEDARVDADVSGFNITVAGFVQGNVKAAGRLEILSTGRVVGDVQAGSLLIEEGGVFHGQSQMNEEKEAAPGEPEEKKRSFEPAAESGEEKQGQPEKQAQKVVSQEGTERTAQP